MLKKGKLDGILLKEELFKTDMMINQIAKVLLIPISFFLLLTCNIENEKKYSIETINDSLIFKYPNPKPVNKITYRYGVATKEQDETIYINSKNLHTISVSINNISNKLIQSPYILGSQGYDFRDMNKLAAKITEGVDTELEKFMRLHQWFSYYYDRFETNGSINPEYDYDSYYGSPLSGINQYGGSMCGDAVHVLNSILWRVPPIGSMYGRRVNMYRHQTGEAWFDGAWHNFDASPEIRWIYFEDDNRTIAPYWKDLVKNDGYLIKRIKPMTGWDIWDSYGKKATTEPHYIVNKDEGTQWDYNYNLKPDEEFTMYYDMQGRTDQISRNYKNSLYNIQNTKEYRNPCDYASAVFTYMPDFTTKLHKKFAVDENNIEWTNNGLVAKDKSKSAYIVYAAKSTWGIVGAEISGEFINEGKVYFAVTNSIKDTTYSKNLKWITLDENTTFESDSMGIEGRMAYWIKFEFNGKNAGLKLATISTEVQINRYTIPTLKYGKNNIHFSADNMNSGEVEITYTYDDQSKYDTYEPATENYGAYIFYRVGGNHTATWTKPLFYKNLKNNPDTLIPVKVEIYKAFGDNAGTVVRTLKDELMNIGTYWWYWNGRDDNGNKCESGMYSFKVTGHVGESDLYKGNKYGERLYLFSNGVWPVSNEINNN